MNRVLLVVAIVVVLWVWYEWKHPRCKASGDCAIGSYCVAERCQSLNGKIVFCGGTFTQGEIAKAWYVEEGKKRKFSALSGLKFVTDYKNFDWTNSVVPFLDCSRITLIPDGVAMPESN